MKHIVLTLSFLLLFSVGAQAQTKSQDSGQTRTTRFVPHTDHKTRKVLLEERDSLLKVLDQACKDRDKYRYELEELKEAYANVGVSSGGFVGEGLEGDFYEAALSEEEVDRDSLLSLYYRQMESSQDDFFEENMDSLVLSSDTPDSVYISRLKRMNSFISLPYNDIVRNYLVAYTQKHNAKMGAVLGLADYYMPIFEEILDQYNLPLELKAMAVIESALNPVAVSRVKAKGMWQFMYSTARRYGLEVTSYVDERFDPVKSADAAARYMRDSYLLYGDWALAIASYNCGPGNVNKAIRRSGGGKDFWEIYRYLPRETRGYVPSFIAALYMMTYYNEHHLRPVPANLSTHMDTLKISRMLHFDQVVHFTGIPKEQLRYYNPQYLHDIIPGQEGHPYILRLPYNYVTRFVENEDQVYKYKDTVYFSPAAVKQIKDGASPAGQQIVHKVKSGETLSHIAMKYHVKVSDLQRWNGVKNNLRIGQRIVIYTDGGRGAGASSSSASSSSASSVSSSKNTTTSGGYVYYTVRKGDSLSTIAAKFSGVTVNSIMSLNSIQNSSKIYPGMKLKIKKQ